MNRNQLRTHCLSKKEAVETFPFGNDLSVFKVMNKIFALIPAAGVISISLKCEPTWAQILRQSYEAVKPGYHLNHEHWNTVQCDGSISDDEVISMIDHSYEEVVKGLTRAQRKALGQG